MIKVKMDRTHNGYSATLNEREVSVAAALEIMLIYEIGYGGNVVKLEKDCIQVNTTIMACKDTTLFTGSEKEMSLLVEAAVYAIQLNPFGKDMPAAYTDAVSEMVHRITGGKPLLVAMGGGMIVGKSVIKLVLLHMIGDEALAPKLTALTNENLLAVMMLVREDGVSAQAALELAVAQPVFDNAGKVVKLAA